ncbi:gliding motility-associated C-terminal domain-containing protein [Mucilaginibacter gotjawali]|uniref:Gliding motility-associated-like protein n=2 Tax=Mucilaginibacter gotjawali TaxID=1550579 RepID=A0A839SEL9_9SPHI|nr:gliding motility-associated C-terminal domain-containing protein [Mucilaginibacter gotjawali]MBB3055089.1 gliding motility-associated-like protein [Mucilaginibacter gotjawali]BAU56294.1 hypothetical protein MgSA37_04491 [Mucilaginibacter gotjawali]
MLHKKFLLFFLLFLFSLRAFSAVFVVTSNADSGPGTLRDALMQAAANGSAAQDVIQFKLVDVSVAGRTITLITQLPDLSSNLLIDGTTQPGAPFGATNSRVEVSTPVNNDPFTTFNLLGINNVEIDGLYIYDYSYANSTWADLKTRYAFNIANSTNITIGAPGKGNLIRGFKDRVVNGNGVDFLNIQGNVIGLTPEDSATETGDNMPSGGISLYHCNNINIGGAGSAGNIFFIGIEINFAQNSTGNVLSIKSNNFGVFQDGVTTSFEYQLVSYVRVNTDFLNQFGFTASDAQKCATAQLDIENNTSGNFETVFSINALKGGINFYSNYLGLAGDGTTSLNSAQSRANEGLPVGISNCQAQVNFGTGDAAQANYLGDCFSAIAAANSPNIFIRKNVFNCISTGAYFNDAAAGVLPVVALNKTNTVGNQTTLSGTSNPGALIDVYSSESCTYANCSIRNYIETVTADNTGKWQANILNFSGIFYVSATVNNVTSEYKTFQIDATNVVVKNLRCTNIATISGLIVPTGLTYYWVDENGNIISHSLDLTVSKPGKYQLVLGGGCIVSEQFRVDDDRVIIYDNGLVKTDISCGTSNGSIKNLFVYDPLSEISTYVWKDGSGSVVGHTLEVAGLTAGDYTLTVNTSDGCVTTYGPVTLKNVSGPNIDQSNPNIQSTNCGQSTGSITNLVVTGTGTLKYTWWNSQQQTVGTTKDLLGQPAGTYKLEVMDDSQCGPVYSSDITIPETNGITLDETKATPGVASCSNNNGSITGIIVTGATKYIWTDAAGHSIITVDPDLLNVAPGDYTLTTSNTSGCSKTSQTYHVGQDPPTQYPVYAATIVPACFGKNNGSVSVATDLLVSSARWIDSQGLPKGGSSAQLTDVPAGTYQLFVTDKNGCENLYNSYTVTTIPQLQILPGSEKIVDDQCTLHTGVITNVQVSGGLQPYAWSWLDANKKIVSSTPDLSGVGAGVYTLIVNDASGCGLVSAAYTVQNQTDNIPAPAVSNLQLCSAGDALLQVSNPSAVYTYRLYDAQTGSTPMDEQANGNFKITVKSNTTYYVSQVSGDCESPRSAVQVSVGISAVDIANAFTPNGDGINDYWTINGIASYPSAIVQVFTRNGQKVFESIGYPKPFDGTYSGKQLPEGVYYYIINLKSNCNLLSGSLTIIR